MVGIYLETLVNLVDWCGCQMVKSLKLRLERGQLLVDCTLERVDFIHNLQHDHVHTRIVLLPQSSVFIMNDGGRVLEVERLARCAQRT